MGKKNKKSGLTSQGVRDLSYIKAPSKGIRLEMPPEPEDFRDNVINDFHDIVNEEDGRYDRRKTYKR